MKLPLIDHLCWLVLRRVRRGGVARHGEHYLDGGRPLGGLLAELLAELREQGLLDVAEPGPEDGLARVSCTDAGHAHYRTLCRRQRAPRPAPPPGSAPAPLRRARMAESADVLAGRRLLDLAKRPGFRFQRITARPRLRRLVARIAASGGCLVTLSPLCPARTPSMPRQNTSGVYPSTHKWDSGTRSVWEEA